MISTFIFGRSEIMDENVYSCDLQSVSLSGVITPSAHAAASGQKKNSHNQI